MAKRYTIKKYGGDDRYSWAVFDHLCGRPVVTGCSRREAQYHRDSLERKHEERGKK